MFGFFHRFARSMIYPGSRVPFPPAEELARRLPGARLIDYRSADGIDLRGALVPATPAADPAAPVAVYFHGNGESAAHNLPFAADLASRGIGVFLAEYRGYGGLKGAPTEDGLYADGDAAVKAAGVSPERLVLVGRSLGSGVATELAVRHPCALLVLISPYTSMVDMGRIIAGPAAKLAVPDRYDNLDKIGRVRCPAVILHGTRDEVIPIRMGRALAAAAPGVTLVEVPEASHNDFPGLEELTAREIGKAIGK